MTSIHLVVLLSGLLHSVFAESTEDNISDNNPFTCQKHVIDALRKEGYLQNKEVEKAMSDVDLKAFEDEYVKPPVYYGGGKLANTVHMYAYALDTLSEHLKPGNTALDVDCGTGYLTACMAMLVGETGYAVGTDNSVKDLQKPINIIKNTLPQLLEKNQVRFVERDNLYTGCPNDGPYDAIHVAIVTDDVEEECLRIVDQLKKGGRMMITIAGEKKDYKVRIYDKDLDGNVKNFEEPGVFVDMKEGKEYGDDQPIDIENELQ